MVHSTKCGSSSNNTYWNRIKPMKITNIRVMGDKIELWETKEEHIEKLIINHEQFEWLTDKKVGMTTVRELNKSTSFAKRYKIAKNRAGYEVEKIAPIIHRTDENGIIRSKGKVRK